MEGVQQCGIFSGLTSSNYERTAVKKRKCSSLYRCSDGAQDLVIVDKKALRVNRAFKNICLTANRVGLFHHYVNPPRCISSMVSFKSSSDCGTGPCTEDEKFTEENGHSTVSTEEDFVNLVKGPTSPISPNPGNVRSELISLALPAVAGQAIDPLAQLMETAFIGRLGVVELASAGVSVSIFNIISKLFNIPLLSITTSFVAEDISKYFLAKNVPDGGFQENSEDEPIFKGNVQRLELPSVSTALVLASAIGTIEALALFWGSGLFLNIMGISSVSPMRGTSQKFLSIRAMGAPAVVVSLAVQGVFRGFKDTKTPLYCLGLGNLAAVILLPILMYSFHFGATGAAVATVTSQYITTFLLLWSLSKKAVILPPRIEDLQFGGYIKSGGLLLGRTLSVLITMTLGTAMAARQGPLSMAAHQICLQVWLAISLLSDALAVSAQALIASSFAKCDYKKVKEITYYVLKIGLFTGIALAVVLSTSFGYLAQLFSKDADVLQIVRTGVLFVSASQPINALAFIFDGLHYGVSDFSYPAWSMMVVGTISSIFLLYAPSAFGLYGVWAGLTLFMSLRMVAGILRLSWKKGPWWFLQQETQ